MTPKGVGPRRRGHGTYANAPAKVERSKVFWTDWLPAYEELSVDGGTPSRRWFVWGQDVSGSWDGAGGIGGLLAIREEGGRTLLPVHDGLGNITAVIHAGTGDTVARYDYAPFGELVAESGDVNACPFRYQSKYYDAETGLSYFGFRYYSAKLGRWISRDPLGEDGGFNLYGYCGNDPVNGWDYLGMLDNEVRSLGEVLARLESTGVGAQAAASSRFAAAAASTNAVGWSVMGGMFISAGIDPNYTATLLPPRQTPVGAGPLMFSAPRHAPPTSPYGDSYTVEGFLAGALSRRINEALVSGNRLNKHGEIVDSLEVDIRYTDAWGQYLLDRQTHGEDEARRRLNYTLDDIQQSGGRLLFESDADIYRKILNLNPWRNTKVERHALEDKELRFAQMIVNFRGGVFVGAPHAHYPGIDGWLDGVPVSLKQLEGQGTGYSVLSNVMKAQAQIKKAGLSGVEMYIEAPKMGRSELLNFARGGPLMRIPSEGLISAINVYTSDGWVRIIGN